MKKTDKAKVIVGAPESMSKSKKNTIDPETMIKQYGADAVRWFILSDSPPEKDVLWSDTGVASANKFLQKIWNLNYLISKRSNKEFDKNLDRKFTLEINNYVNKIDSSIKNFRFNVSIAHFYEVYKVFKEGLDSALSTNLLTNNIIKIMKLMLPFTPHLANECLELLDCKTVNQWPEIDKKNTLEEIKFAIQINGKTRDIINIERNLVESEIHKIINKNPKTEKYFKDKKIIKTIFVRDKIINYIIN